jgi:hypothetical protein
MCRCGASSERVPAAPATALPVVSTVELDTTRPPIRSGNAKSTHGKPSLTRGNVARVIAVFSQGDNPRDQPSDNQKPGLPAHDLPAAFASNAILAWQEEFGTSAVRLRLSFDTYFSMRLQLIDGTSQKTLQNVGPCGSEAGTYAIAAKSPRSREGSCSTMRLFVVLLRPPRSGFTFYLVGLTFSFRLGMTGHFADAAASERI